MRSGILATVAALAASGGLMSQEWGTLKGKVVFGGEAPKAEAIKIDKDQDHCLSKGDIPSEKLVVDPATKGVRWVMVWLVDSKDPKAALPIHSSLKEAASKEVFVDQPCCKFEPHVVALREGQTLVAKTAHPSRTMSTLSAPGKTPPRTRLSRLAVR